MRIDEAGEGGGHNNACLTKPFPKRCRSYEDAGKGQGEYNSGREAKGPTTLGLAFCLLLQSLDREDCSIDDRGQSGTDQRNREGSKSSHARSGENNCHLDDRRNR